MINGHCGNIFDKAGDLGCGPGSLSQPKAKIFSRDYRVNAL